MMVQTADFWSRFLVLVVALCMPYSFVGFFWVGGLSFTGFGLGSGFRFLVFFFFFFLFVRLFRLGRVLRLFRVFRVFRVLRVLRAVKVLGFLGFICFQTFGFRL